MRTQTSKARPRTRILVLLASWVLAMLGYAIVSSFPEGGVLLLDDLVAVAPLVAAAALAPFVPRVAGAVLLAYAGLSWTALRSPVNLALLTLPSIAFGCALFTKSARRTRASAARPVTVSMR